jgi:hypothetical protein
MGEMGGKYDINGTSPETISDQVDLTIDPAEIANPNELVLGLYGGSSLGSGISDLTFDVTANGSALVDETFTSTSAAINYFTNDALQLGAISQLGASGAISFDLSLSETTSSANSGFFANFLLGASHT